MESRTRIELPPQVRRPFEVFVNGVPQVEGTDFEAVGSTLLFPRTLAREGKIGFWRWARLFLGVAGTYKQNDTIDGRLHRQRAAAGRKPRGTAG